MKQVLGYDTENLKDRRARGTFFLLCGMAFLGSAVYFFALGRSQSAVLSLLFLLLLFLIPKSEHLLGLQIPPLTFVLILFLMLGSLLGSGYNFYILIPFWDTILHTLSGLLFACIGYAICNLLFTNREKRSEFPYIFVGILFSLAVALLWELFEAGVTLLLAVDMQEDTLVYNIKSFYLSGTHDHATYIADIKETVIHYGDGRELRLAGYLDLGLADTLGDMAVCVPGNILFLLLFPIDRRLGGRLLPHLLPRRVTPLFSRGRKNGEAAVSDRPSE